MVNSASDARAVVCSAAFAAMPWRLGSLPMVGDFLEVGLAGRGAAGGFQDVQVDFHRAGEGDEINLRRRDEALTDFHLGSSQTAESRTEIVKAKRTANERLSVTPHAVRQK